MAFSVRSIGRVVVFRFAGLVQARVVCDREHAEGLCIGADGFVIVAAGFQSICPAMAPVSLPPEAI